MDLRPTHPPPTTRERAAWCMFDFANSSFTTIMITVVYPQVFVTLAADRRGGDIGWAWAMVVSQSIVLLLSPVLGALADRQARKKRYLAASWIGCVLACGALSLVGQGPIALAWTFIVLANIGFSVGESLIAAFLPELAAPSEMGRLSGMGWAVGYFGGLISLVIALQLVSAHAVEWVPAATAGFFFLAGLPTLIFLRERARPRPQGGHSVVAGAIAEVRRTLAQRRRYPDLFRLLTMLFLQQAGVAVVNAFASLYAEAEFGMSREETIVLFIGLQIAAAAGAALFGFIQDKIGGKRAIAATILLWLLAVGVVLLTHSMPVFCVGAALAGMALGSSQASGRAMVGTFTPPDRQGEWFGLWGIAMRAAGVVGVTVFALARGSGSIRQAMWSTAVFFIMSLVVLATVDERRGMRSAASPDHPRR